MIQIAFSYNPSHIWEVRLIRSSLLLLLINLSQRTSNDIGNNREANEVFHPHLFRIERKSVPHLNRRCPGIIRICQFLFLPH